MRFGDRQPIVSQRKCCQRRPPVRAVERHAEPARSRLRGRAAHRLSRSLGGCLCAASASSTNATGTLIKSRTARTWATSV